MTTNNAINTEAIASLSVAAAGTGNGLITPYNAYKTLQGRGLTVNKQNLGMVLPGGSLLRIRAADGTSLSASNYGTIAIPSKLNQGETNSYQVTSNKDLAWSDLTNNLFGTTSGVAWGSNIRFYLYAVQNAAEDDFVFMISRMAYKSVSPASSIIGTPASAVADTQGSFFAFSSVTVADYENNPCVCLGSFYAIKSSSEVWTVNTLDRQTGINRFGNGFLQTFPQAQFGAIASRTFLPNGGTAPNFSSVFYQYFLMPGNLCYMIVNLGTGSGASGAVNARMTLPFDPAYDGYAAIPCSLIAPTETGFYPILHTGNYCEFKRVSAGTFLQYSTSLTNVAISMTYQVSDS